MIITIVYSIPHHPILIITPAKLRLGVFESLSPRSGAWRSGFAGLGLGVWVPYPSPCFMHQKTGKAGIQRIWYKRLYIEQSSTIASLFNPFQKMTPI